MTFHKYTRS